MFKILIVICSLSLWCSDAAKLDHLVRRPSSKYQPQGYNYERPPQPIGLYEQPAAPATSTTFRPPPPPPSGLYEFPQETNPQPDYHRPQVDVPMMPEMPYEFNWGVDDEESGNKYSQVESQDGNILRGEYRVLLPDGRTQIVTYFDDGSGYNAEVTYV